MRRVRAPHGRRRLAVAIVVVVVATTLVLYVTPTAPRASAADFRPKTVLMAGDSLTTETRLLFHKTGWRIKVYSYPGTAPCDWITAKPPNLLTLIARRPAYLFIETAGNNLSKCMRYPDGDRIMPGSRAFLTHYEDALTTIFHLAIREGVRIVYVVPPPMFLQNFNKANLQIASWVKHGKGHPGVIEALGPREALSLNGKPTLYLPCLHNETRAMGCVHGLIAVRTVNDPAHTHFCPSSYDWITGFLCGVYSSGEHRWAHAVDKLIIGPGDGS